MRHQTLDGAESRTRTCNLLITGQLLYQLSYSSECDIILPQIRNMSRDKIGNDMEIKASVREIAELLFGSGDLAGEEYLRRRAEEGILIHKEHQSRYLAGDEKEFMCPIKRRGKITVYSSAENRRCSEKRQENHHRRNQIDDEGFEYY